MPLFLDFWVLAMNSLDQLEDRVVVRAIDEKFDMASRIQTSLEAVCRGKSYKVLVSNGGLYPPSVTVLIRGREQKIENKESIEKLFYANPPAVTHLSCSKEYFRIHFSNSDGYVGTLFGRIDSQ